MLPVPAQQARLDPTAWIFFYISDTEDLPEVSVQSSFEMVLGSLFGLRG